MNLDGSNVRNLTSSTFDDHLTFSPKHNKVAFISNREEGNNDVFVMNR